jgi:hypothetical protein
MTEREQHASRPDADPADLEHGQPGTGPQSVSEDAVTPAEQAASNQEQALESGEENVV